MNLQADRVEFADGKHCRATGTRGIPGRTGKTIEEQRSGDRARLQDSTTLGDTNPATAVKGRCRPLDRDDKSVGRPASQERADECAEGRWKRKRRLRRAAADVSTALRNGKSPIATTME